MIICGKQAIDGDTAQVGPGIAEWLDIPQVTFVRKIEEIRDNYIRAQQTVEQGYEVIEAQLPCLITVIKEINEPRLLTLRGKLRAKSIEIPVWGIDSLGLKKESVGLNGSPTQVIKIFTPEPKKGGEIFKGDSEEAVEKLVGFIKKVYG